MSRNKIGERVKKFRYQNRPNSYSQGWFAAHAGVSQGYISALENGTIKPSADVVARLEKLLEILTVAEKAASDARNNVLAQFAGNESFHAKIDQEGSR
jgi:predicted transcriptional regulator